MTNFETITASICTVSGLTAALMKARDDWCIYCGNQDKCNLLIEKEVEIQDDYCAKHIARWLESEAQ
ncbi:MAG: hypothetical protein RSE54_11665 [Ruthenibacterium sp.]